MEKKIKYTFSGHETFHCRPLWLPKGYLFVKEKKSFSDETAVLDLGVGKNMVSSIRYWLRAFGIINDSYKLNDEHPAKFLFGKKYDSYLEDNASLWLLHYYLVKTNKASIYNLFFNYFRRERIEFKVDSLDHFIRRKCSEPDSETAYNDRTVSDDINVLLKMYTRPYQVTKNIEDEYSGLFIDLNLIQLVHSVDTVGKYYIAEPIERPDIPWQILLFAILDFTDSTLISVNDLLNQPNSPGLIFCMNAVGLIHKINEIVSHYPSIHFTDENGIRELRFKTKPESKWDLLSSYYGKK